MKEINPSKLTIPSFYFIVKNDLLIKIPIPKISVQQIIMQGK